MKDLTPDFFNQFNGEKIMSCETGADYYCEPRIRESDFHLEPNCTLIEALNEYRKENVLKYNFYSVNVDNEVHGWMEEPIQLICGNYDAAGDYEEIFFGDGFIIEYTDRLVKVNINVVGE